VQRIKKRYILPLLIIVAVIVLKPTLFISAKTFLFETFSLPFRFVNRVGARLKRKSSYLHENSVLKERAAVLALELSKTSEIIQENQRLKSLLKFKENASHKSIPAEVIRRSPSAWSESILINKGRNHGIKKRMPVCTPSGLVGSVVEVGPFTSKVMLITDPNSRVGVIVKDIRNAAILVGSGRAQCKVIYLPMDSDIKMGEEVLTSRYGRLFPKGLAVAKIEEVGIDKIAFYKYAFVKPNQDMNSIEEVLCIE